MPNQFYNKFDLERFPEVPLSETEYRSVFQIERDRIIFSYPFRRLQSKTQVFQSGEYDFYRTRLTHSIEVAKIGRSICDFLKASSKHLSKDFYIDPDLTEAVGLAHDLGHPPFGHIGERKLNALMQPHGGFEGNAQTLRILTELIYERPGETKGIAPTRAFLDGVLKYKSLYTESIKHDPSGKAVYPKNHFIYDTQANWRETVFGDHEIPAELNNPNALNHYKSIECQIMDWADDTAYSLNDIVDGIHARYVTIGSLTEWAEANELDKNQSALVEKLTNKIRKNSYEPYFGSRIGNFVHACTLKPRADFLSDQTHRHAFDLEIDPSAQVESKLYKKIAYELIFRTPQLQQIEFKGGYILQRLFEAFTESEKLQLLPVQVQQLLATETTESGRKRRLCDYIAGLTDGLAVRTYKRLYDPDFGSIAELV
jgi:dGTPase